MQGSFQRARAFGGGTRLWVAVFGILGAFFPPVLVVLLGIAVQLQIDPELGQAPTDVLLGYVFQNPFIAGKATAQQKLSVIAALAFVFSALQALSWTMLRRAARAAARAAAAGLKNEIHSQAFRLGANDVLGTAGSWPEVLFTEKVEIVRQGLAAWWRAIPQALVLMVLLLLLALVVHPWLTILGVVLALFVWRIDAWLREMSGHQARLWNERAQLADERLVETLSLAPLATNYALADPPSESFADLLRQQQSAGYRADSHEAARSPWFWMIVLWSVVFFFLIMAASPSATFSGTVVLAAALCGAALPIRRLWRLRSSLPAWDLAARDIFAYLERTPTISAAADAKPLPKLQRDVRLDNVTLLDREGHKVLDEVSLTFPANSRVAILTTDQHTARGLWGLFVRFYDPVAGRVLFDDCDIRWATVDSVRRQTSLVLSDALLFTATVAQNIGCGQPEFSVDEIHDAAKDAHALDFVYQLPDGFETIVGEQGLKLEPSMAFRVALARAIIHEPSLMVIEEPHAHLSPEDGAAVDAALAAAGAGRTLLIQPARLSTLRSADLVVLLHAGQVVAAGKHTDLLQSSDLYRHLNYMRFHPFPDVA